MASIKEAELLQKRIENHGHFYNCLVGFEFDNFNSKRNDLNKCITCYNNLKYYETEIIRICCDKKNIEQLLENLKITNEKDLENVQKKLEVLEELKKKENEITLNDYKNKYKTDDLKNYYELIELDKELSNLDKDIKEIKENLDNELNLKKKEKLFKLSNDYKFKLLQYTNQKKLEKQLKENDLEIQKKRFEAKKEIELNELREKALLAQQIICLYKNISLI